MPRVDDKYADGRLFGAALVLPAGIGDAEYQANFKLGKLPDVVGTFSYSNGTSDTKLFTEGTAGCSCSQNDDCADSW